MCFCSCPNDGIGQTQPVGAPQLYCQLGDSVVERDDLEARRQEVAHSFLVIAHPAITSIQVMWLISTRA